MKYAPEELMEFVGRKNIYAQQQENGGYHPVYEPLTPEVLQQHLNGEKTIGSYIIREDGLITCACIDIDGPVGKDLTPYEQLGNYVMELFPEFKRVLEHSGRRGYHVWLLLKSPEPPRFIRELIYTRLRIGGVKGIEVFPKQDSVDETKKKLGNLVKIPCGKHKKGGWSKIITRIEP
jgi:hypothetical protein